MIASLSAARDANAKARQDHDASLRIRRAAVVRRWTTASSLSAIGLVDELSAGIEGLAGVRHDHLIRQHQRAEADLEHAARICRRPRMPPNAPGDALPSANTRVR